MPVRDEASKGMLTLQAAVMRVESFMRSRDPLKVRIQHGFTQSCRSMEIAAARMNGDWVWLPVYLGWQDAFDANFRAFLELEDCNGNPDH